MPNETEKYVELLKKKIKANEIDIKELISGVNDEETLKIIKRIQFELAIEEANTYQKELKR